MKNKNHVQVSRLLNSTEFIVITLIPTAILPVKSHVGRHVENVTLSGK